AGESGTQGGKQRHDRYFFDHTPIPNRPDYSRGSVTTRYQCVVDRLAAAKTCPTQSFTSASTTRCTRSSVPRFATLCGSERRKYQQLPASSTTRSPLSRKSTASLVTTGMCSRIVPSSKLSTTSSCSLMTEPGVRRTSRTARSGARIVCVTSRKQG